MTENCNAVIPDQYFSLSKTSAWLGRSWPWLGFAVVLGLYVFLQVRCYRPGHVEPDLDGYTWLAKRLATGAPLMVKPDTPFHYQSHVWVENDRGEVTVKYAPGHPLVMALFYRLFGDEGIFLVSPVAGALALLAMFLLFRLWMRPLAALLALLTVTLNEQFLFFAGYLLSHMLDVCLVTWGMYFLWCWLARPAAGWGIGAGLTLGYAVLVRHTSVALGLCVLAAILIVLWRERRERRLLSGPVIWLGAAYALFPLLLGLYDLILFGNACVTGYALSNEQDAFSWQLLVQNYPHFLENGFQHFLFVAMPFGCLGLFVLGRWTDRVLWWTWALPLTLLYGSYYWYMPWGGFFRFLLCLLPLFVGLAFALIDALNVSPWRRALGLCVLALAMLGHFAPAIQRAYTGITHRGHSSGTLPAGRIVAATLKPDAVIFSQDSLVNCIGMRREFTMYDLGTFSKAGGIKAFPLRRDYTLAETQRGIVQPRQQPQRAYRFAEFYRRTSQEQLQAMKRELVQKALQAGRQVAFLIDKNRAGAERAALGPDALFTVLKEFDVTWYGWGDQPWTQHLVLAEARLKTPDAPEPARQ